MKYLMIIALMLWCNSKLHAQDHEDEPIHDLVLEELMYRCEFEKQYMRDSMEFVHQSRIKDMEIEMQVKEKEHQEEIIYITKENEGKVSPLSAIILGLTTLLFFILFIAERNRSKKLKDVDLV